MHRLTLSLAFGLLLAFSIAIKVQSAVRGVSSTRPSDGDDIVALLGRNGFAVELADSNTDPPWVYGKKDRCRLQIAAISPQGWHRAALEWQARGRVLLYSVGGELHGKQPILEPMAVDYLRRLQRYVGISEPPVRARAIIIDKTCPVDPIPPRELEALSR